MRKLQLQRLIREEVVKELNQQTGTTKKFTIKKEKGGNIYLSMSESEIIINDASTKQKIILSDADFTKLMNTANRYYGNLISH